MMGGILLDGSVDSHLMSNYQELTTLSEAGFNSIISSNTSNLQSASLNDHYNYIQLEEEVPLGVDHDFDAADYYQRLLSLLEPSTFSYDNPCSTINYEVDNRRSYSGYIPYHSLNADTTVTIFPLSFPSAPTNNSITYPSNFQQLPIPVAGSSSPFVSDDSVGKNTGSQATENQGKRSDQQCGKSDGHYSSCIATSSTALSLTSIISTNAATGPLVTVEDEGYHDNLDIKNSEMRHCFLSSSGQSESLESQNRNRRDIGVMSNTGISEKLHPPIIADKVIKKKRKRTRSRKNIEEMESQRMTHIAVERNRRQQMNLHLNALRSLMPSSYIQRGDQASIVGGAIRFVGELEQVLQSLRLQRQMRRQASSVSHVAGGSKPSQLREESYACSQSSNVSVEVNMASSSSILVKVLVPRRPHQLLHTLHAFNLLSLKVLHLNITSLDITMLYSFNLEVEKSSKFQNPIELAKSIHHILETSKDNISLCDV